MPTYEYRCQKCHKTFEAVQSMKDPHFSICPEALCQQEGGWGQGEVTRLLGTGAGLIFKGSGFYITDYRSENYKQGAKKESGDSGGSGGGEKKAGAESGGSGGAKETKSAPAAGGSSGGAPPASSPSTPAAPSPAPSAPPKPST